MSFLNKSEEDIVQTGKKRGVEHYNQLQRRFHASFTGFNNRSENTRKHGSRYLNTYQHIRNLII